VFLLSPKSCSSPWSDSGDWSLDLEELTRGCCSSRAAQATPVWPVLLTGLTGATLVGFLLRWTPGCVCCCPVLQLFRVWVSLDLGRPIWCFGAFWLRPVWPVCYTGLTDVEPFCGSRQVSPVGTGLTGGGQWTRGLVFRCVLGSWGWKLVPRFSSTPVATWTWPTWVVSRGRVLEIAFILLEPSSPSRIIFIGSHSLPPLVRRIGPSERGTYLWRIKTSRDLPVKAILK
jgi:hypothetical protein